MTTYQILGSTRLARAAVHYLLDQGRGRIVGLDPGEEDESRPWFSPVRGLCRDNGIFIGRRPAEIVLDLDPDERPTKGEGYLVRLIAPQHARSPDINRAILDPVPPGIGGWLSFFGNSEGFSFHALKEIPIQSEEGAEALLQRATLACIEALAEGLQNMHAGITPSQLPRPPIGGRWRAQESFITWEQPASRVLARIRAASGPWGGARTALGTTTLWLDAAELVSEETPKGWLPGTIFEIEAGRGIVVTTGRGLIRLPTVRPGWRPSRPAAEYAGEVGASVGYQLT